MQSLIKIFGENIRLIRQAKGYSQENVAQLLGMSHSGYAKIERGESDISLSRMEEIAKILEVEAARLISATDKLLVFNSKKNMDKLENATSRGAFNFQSDKEELAALLKKTMESLTQLVDLVVLKAEK